MTSVGGQVAARGGGYDVLIRETGRQSDFRKESGVAPRRVLNGRTSMLLLGGVLSIEPPRAAFSPAAKGCHRKGKGVALDSLVGVPRDNFGGWSRSALFRGHLPASLGVRMGPCDVSGIPDRTREVIAAAERGVARVVALVPRLPVAASMHGFSRARGAVTPR
jgi:hypothetical protein